MNITLCISEPHRLSLVPNELASQERVIREKFKNVGLPLLDRTAHQITYGDSIQTINERYVAEYKQLKRKWKKGDMSFVDYEPRNFNHSDQYHPHYTDITTQLIRQAKWRTPGRKNVGLYGLPYSQWWAPFGRESGESGLKETHHQSKPDWFGPQFYQSYNIGDKGGLDLLRRALQIRNTCSRVGPTIPIHPFVQPVLRHSDHDYAEMTDETVYEVWSSLAWAGLTEPIWWFECGGRNEQFTKHLDRIERHAPIIIQAVTDTKPGL